MTNSYRSKWSMATALTLILMSHFETFADVSKSIADKNSIYGIYIIQDGNPAIQPTDSLLTIITQRNAEEELKQAIMKSLQSSLTGLTQIFSSGLQQGSDFNLQSQGMRAVGIFTENLKKNLATIQIKRKQKFQLMLAPTLSEKMLGRSLSAPQVIANYPADRTMLVELLPDVSDAYPKAQGVMNGNVYKAIVNQLRNHMESNETDQPAFLGLTLTTELDPDRSKSSVISELLVAMPVNIQKDFNNENDQIKFTKIVYPEFKSEGLASFTAEKYPVAIMSLRQALASADVTMNLQFGPLGTYQDGRWIRSPGTDFAKLVPKLRGTPKAKGALNAAAQLVQVDFNIFNINSNLMTQEITNIDLYLSAGSRRFPNLKFGMINSTSIDSQFQAEINKLIEQQTNGLKNHVQEAQQLPVVQQMIQTLLERKK